ncbi:hypothetical protein MYXA107069_34110 [Myxococcus xanthus]
MGPTALLKPGPTRSFASKVATASRAINDAASRNTPVMARVVTSPPLPAFIRLSASALRRVAISCRDKTAFSARPFFAVMSVFPLRVSAA